MHVLIIPSERYLPTECPLEGIFQARLVAALQNAGHQTGVISPEIRCDPRVTFGLKILNISSNIPVLVFIGPNIFLITKATLLFAQFWVGLGNLLIKKYIELYGRPDIIHAHNAAWAGLLAASIKTKWKIPFVLTEHSSAYGRQNIPDYKIKKIQKAFKNADARIVVSPSLGADLIKTLGHVVEPYFCIPNQLDQRFNQKRIVEKSKFFRVLTIGELSYNKGQAILLRAFALAFRDSDAQLRLCGEGRIKADLLSLADRLGIRQQVVFLNWLEGKDILDEIARCDVYVQPSLYETFGVTLIEAMSQGKPVIASRCGGPESFVNKMNGILVAKGDHEALKHALITVKNQISEYDGDKIRQSCFEKFSETPVVNQILGVYRDILMT